MGKNKATSFFQGSHDYHIIFYDVFGNGPGTGKRDVRGNGSAIQKKFILGIYLALCCRFRHPEIPPTILGPGNIVGEISLVRHRPTTADVRALNRVGCLFLKREDFTRIVTEHPEVEQYLDSLSEERLQKLSSGSEPDILDASDLIVL